MNSHEAPNPLTTALSRRIGAIVALSAGLGLVLRFWGLSDKSLWLDEIWSVTVARMPWHSLFWSLQHHDPNMSLYHVLLHVWMGMGSSDFYIRALSVLFGAATIPVVYQLGRRIFDARIGALAAFLFAINLFDIEYSQEARSYGLWVFLCTLASFFFVEAVVTSRNRYWILYCAASILGIYAHLYTFLLLAAHVGSLIFLRQRPHLRKLLLVGASIWICSIPLLFLIYEKMRTPFVPLNWVPHPSVRRVYDLFYALSGNANFYGIEVIKLQTGKLLLIICFVCSLLALRQTLAVIREFGPSNDAWRETLLFFCLFVPILLALVISLRMPLFLNRYFLICVPALCILMARGFSLMRSRWIMMPAFGLFLACAAAAAMQYYHYRAVYGEWRTATQTILREAQPGDAIAFSMAHGRLLFDFYTHALQAGVVPVDEVYPDLRHALDDPNALGYYPAPTNDEIHSLAAHRRVWLVLYPDDMASEAPVSNLLVQNLQENYSRVDVSRIDQILLKLYSQGDPKPGTQASLAHRSSWPDPLLPRKVGY